jgi:phosphoribosylformimino-5-aminoimidazole carboxamide ribotide isomerase
LNVIPAIDLRGGKVVRLKQGDYAQQTTYVMRRRAPSGCTWSTWTARAPAAWTTSP